MATYVYETIPAHASEAPRRYEIQQSMKDAPLTRHPVTGESVRRVISGGYGIMTAAASRSAPPATATPAPCSPGCACHSAPRLPQP
jgi:hypothetical protein